MALNNPYVELIKDYNQIIRNYKETVELEKKEIFDCKRPLVIDLGCGSGNFCVRYATLYPEKNIAGFEIRYKRLVFAARKTLKHNLPNIRFIQSRVEQFDEWVTPGGVSEVFSNFPDPWPKKRHRKHRFLNPVLFDKIYTCLEPGGTFSFKSDYLEYYEEVATILSGSGRFQILEQSYDYRESPFYNPLITSEFEMLFYTQCVPVNYLKAVKL